MPAGLPSSLIERRPDIRQAEDNLIAANAQIGAARALFFPDISLTGFLGGQSQPLSMLFSGPARLASIAPSALTPIFHAGLRAGVRLTEAQENEMLIAYQKSIYGALREVADALATHTRTREQRGEEEKLVAALSESVRLSTLRYRGGLDSYLQVLDAERNLFTGQLDAGAIAALGTAVGCAALSRAGRRLAALISDPSGMTLSDSDGGSYTTGMWVLTGAALLAAVLILRVRAS